ncbi:hypothetical protein [Anoxybacillus sp.]|uniref:hypothetical protein n=1 Tax=Anoxybacillus sp. TaxID=1872573 RepID=UPI00262EF787|nr:hypothetical protein [uncultured Anoxybacillus sp.]
MPLKRIVSCFLVCIMLVGCGHQEISLQVRHSDEKRQGFSKEEVERFVSEPEKANTTINRQLKNKDILNLFLLGLTKEEIRYMNSKETNFFTNKSSLNKWNDLDEQTLQEIFRKQNDHQIIRCDLHKQMLCTVSTIYSIHKKKVMELTISVSLLNPEDYRYAVVLSYKWLIDPKEKKTDFYGVVTTENAVVDYHKFYSSYKSYRDAARISTKHDNKPYQSSVVGYMMRNSLNEEDSRHFGYLYAEMVPSDRTHKYIDVEGFYVHDDKKWKKSNPFSFQDVLDANVNDAMVMFKSPIIRIVIE